jgi:uncharacterized protein (DUF983 family)
MRLARARMMLLRALRLRCPNCGLGRLYARPFRMEATCQACALPFEREHGYFVGAIYINYALTIAGTFAIFLALERWTGLSFRTRLTAAVVLAGSLPVLFHHHSKSFWLGLDHFINPDTRPGLRRVR